MHMMLGMYAVEKLVWAPRLHAAQLMHMMLAVMRG